MKMDFILREATRDEMVERLDKLQMKKPVSIPTLLLLKTYLRHPVFSIDVYVSQDPEYDSLIVCTDINKKAAQWINVFWDPEKLDDETLKKFLRNVPNWNWAKTFWIHFTLEPLCSKLVKIVSEDEFTGKTLSRHGEEGSLMELTRENMKNLELPDGYKMDYLHTSHIPYVFSSWRYSAFQSLDVALKLSKLLPSVAIFKSEDDVETSNPVSFFFQHHTGLLMSSYTAEDHRRKGLGAIVETKLAEKIIDDGDMAIIWVNEGNEISLNLQIKVGFTTLAVGGGPQFFLEKGVTLEELLTEK